jgi:hypothetical protein
MDGEEPAWPGVLDPDVLDPDMPVWPDAEPAADEPPDVWAQTQVAANNTTENRVILVISIVPPEIDLNCQTVDSQINRYSSITVLADENRGNPVYALACRASLR